MFNIIDRYIFKEIFFHFVLTLFICTFVLLMGRILQLMDLMINKGVDFASIARLIFYLMPSFLIITIPISLLIAILLGLSRLSRDNEIIVLKSSGISLYQILRPIAVLSVLAALMTTATGFYLVPYGNCATADLLFTIAKEKASIGIKEKIFNDDFEGLILYAERIPVHGNYMEGVFVSDNRTTDNPAIIIADKGYLVSNPDSMSVTLRLKNGSTHAIDNNLTTYKKMDFSSYDITLDLRTPISRDDKNQKKDTKEMSLAEMVASIKNQKVKDAAFKKLVIDFHNKFTVPLSCLVFGILAIPFGIVKHRTARSAGFVMGLAVVMSYYLIRLWGEALGETGGISPVIGAWAPIVILGITGSYSLVRAANDKSAVPNFISNIISFKWWKELFRRKSQR